MHSAESVDTVYTDPRRDEWNTTIKPALQKISLKRFERMTGKSPADLDRRAEGPQDTPPGTPPAHERQWQMGGAWQHRLMRVTNEPPRTMREPRRWRQRTAAPSGRHSSPDSLTMTATASDILVPRVNQRRDRLPESRPRAPRPVRHSPRRRSPPVPDRSPRQHPSLTSRRRSRVDCACGPSSPQPWARQPRGAISHAASSYPHKHLTGLAAARTRVQIERQGNQTEGEAEGRSRAFHRATLPGPRSSAA